MSVGDIVHVPDHGVLGRVVGTMPSGAATVEWLDEDGERCVLTLLRSECRVIMTAAEVES